MSPSPILSLHEIELSYPSKDGTVRALASVSLAVAPGEFVCIVGPSGCGKTSLLKIIAGFIQPTHGQALLDGKPIVGPGADRGVVFQQPALYPWLSVVDNVAFGPRMRGVERRLRTDQAEAALALVGLGDFGRRAPYELSGGMQQRAAIARVLVNEPRIMLMDEPFGALDALTREHLQEELLNVWRTTGATIILITHSVEEAIYLGTRTLVMSARPGSIVAEVATDFSHVSGDSRTIKSLPEFVSAREEILHYIWRQS